VTPLVSPVLVKRRLTPPKPAIALRIMSSDRPSSCPTAMAAVALSALCRPGIGKLNAGDFMRRIGLAVAEYDLEIRAAAHRCQVDQPRIGLRILAIGDDAAILDLADDGRTTG